MLNRLLKRQIQKHFGESEIIPEKLSRLLNVISESYDHYEKDRKMLERSIDLSSDEMIVLNNKLRKESNEVKKVNNELNRIFNNIDEALFSVDITSYKLTHISAACEKIYGYTPEEFYSTTDLWQKVIYREDKHITNEQLEALSKGEHVSNQYRIIHKNRNIRWIENKIIPTLDEGGRLIRIDGVTSDINAKKLGEISLPEKEEQMQTIFNAVTDAIIIIDDKSNIIKWDTKAENLFGWKEKEVMGNQLSEIIIPLPYREAHIKGFKHFMKTGNGPLLGKTIEVRALNKNNVEFDVCLSISASLIKNKYQFIGFVRDITERKQSERETLTLVDSLQTKNKDLRQFAYIVSHNLRAPIAKIQGLAMLFDSAPENTVFNEKLLENITNEAVNLDNVVKDLNAIITARDSGNLKKEYTLFETDVELIKQVLENEINDSKAVITSDFTEVKGINTVKSYLYSIIYNLLSNSIKYNRNNEPLKVHLQTTKNDNFVCFSVKDNGAGIDMDKYREKIFGLYKRFHGAEIPGRGVGLNLVKTQIESLGGKVELESKVNTGSVFKIYFPKL